MADVIIVSHWRVLKLITGEDFEVAEVKKIDNLWLIRHPETSLNVGGCLRGHIDIGLTQQGQNQISDILGSILSVWNGDNNPEAVYSSDLFRATSTAEQLANTFKLPLFITEDLRPANLGELTGKPIKDVVHILQEIDDAGDDGQFPGGESVKQFKNRIHRVFTYLRNNQ